MLCVLTGFNKHVSLGIYRLILGLIDKREALVSGLPSSQNLIPCSRMLCMSYRHSWVMASWFVCLQVLRHPHTSIKINSRSIGVTTRGGHFMSSPVPLMMLC